MLQLSQIKDNYEQVLAGLAKRGKDFSDTLNKILLLDVQRKKVQTELDQHLAEANRIAREIGDLYKQGKTAEAELRKTDSATHKEDARNLEEQLAVLESDLRQLLYLVPNVPHASVAAGKSAEDNEEVYSWGTLPNLGKNKKPHWELASEHDLIDFELGVKIAGAGFPVYKGKGAQLQRALIRFFLEAADKAGYLEIMPPLLVNEASGIGTGQLPGALHRRAFHAPADGRAPSGAHARVEAGLARTGDLPRGRSW